MANYSMLFHRMEAQLNFALCSPSGRPSGRSCLEEMLAAPFMTNNTQPKAVDRLVSIFAWTEESAGCGSCSKRLLTAAAGSIRQAAALEVPLEELITPLEASPDLETRFEGSTPWSPAPEELDYFRGKMRNATRTLADTLVVQVEQGCGRDSTGGVCLLPINTTREGSAVLQTELPLARDCPVMSVYAPQPQVTPPPRQSPGPCTSNCVGALQRTLASTEVCCLRHELHAGLAARARKEVHVHQFRTFACPGGYVGCTEWPARSQPLSVRTAFQRLPPRQADLVALVSDRVQAAANITRSLQVTADECAAGVVLPSGRALPCQPPSFNVSRVTIFHSLRCSWLLASPIRQARFTAAFIEDQSLLLGIPQSQISVLGIRCGSIAVEWTARLQQGEADPGPAYDASACRGQASFPAVTATVFELSTGSPGDAEHGLLAGETAASVGSEVTCTSASGGNSDTEPVDFVTIGIVGGAVVAAAIVGAAIFAVYKAYTAKHTLKGPGGVQVGVGASGVSVGDGEHDVSISRRRKDSSSSEEEDDVESGPGKESAVSPKEAGEERLSGGKKKLKSSKLAWVEEDVDIIDDSRAPRQ